MTVPTPDLGQVTLASSTYAVVQAGSMRPNWYYDYFGAWYPGGYFEFRYFMGEGENGYYWDNYGRDSFSFGYYGYAPSSTNGGFSHEGDKRDRSYQPET